MIRDTKPLSWIKAAKRGFDEFPREVRVEVVRALTLVAEGRTPDKAKPMKGLGTGVFEIALRFRGDAFRVVYALHLGEEVWVVHAFQKKSKSGIATPQHEIDAIRARIARIREARR